MNSKSFLTCRPRRYRLVLPLLAVACVTAGCAHTAPGMALPIVVVVSGAAACSDRLALTPLQSALANQYLDPSHIRLLNWNIQKTDAGSWPLSIRTEALAADLVLIQEASLRENTIANHDSSRHWSFVPGYRRHGEVTGVMTLSRVQPTVQCGFLNAEPLLRTPKATNVTQFRLQGRDDTLLVVNVHAVNFSLGLGAFQKQFRQIRELLATHKGPVILSGDLNTWRDGRLRIVEDLAADEGMTAVVFANDQRVTKFGRTLDHIYLRGLRALDASTQDVDTSDHNPMSAVLSM